MEPTRAPLHSAQSALNKTVSSAPTFLVKQPSTASVSKLKPPSSSVVSVLPAVLLTDPTLAAEASDAQEFAENTSPRMKRKGSAEDPLPAPVIKRPVAAVAKGKVVPAASATTTRPPAASARPAAVAPAKSSISAAAKKPIASASVSANSAAVKARIASTAAANPKPSAIAAPSAATTVSVPGKRASWDYKGRLEDMETFASSLRSKAAVSESEVCHLETKVTTSHEQIDKLEALRRQLEDRVQLKEQESFSSSTRIRELEAELRIKDAETAAELSSLNSRHAMEQEALQNQISLLRREKDTLERALRESQDEISHLRIKIAGVEREVSSLESALKATKSHLEETQATLTKRDEELCLAKDDIFLLRSTVSKLSNEGIKIQMELRATADALALSRAENDVHVEEIHRLRALVASHESTIAACEQRIREDEATRRKLHNAIQELKGNIRVFCRVRPLLPSETGKSSASGVAKMDFPDKDSKAIVLSESTTGVDGKTASKPYEFTFDRVFQPSASQSEVFEEISQLVQSALDGYNVCIFAYGQTGSGKTYTMEGPALPTTNARMSDGAMSVAHQASCGMIPRAVAQIFSTAKQLERKGWKYEMEAMFLEIYNESINDLLGDGDVNKKHDIKIRADKPDEVFVTDTVTVRVENENEVFSLLHRASQNRAVAETHCNARSSRSHSVFRLKLSGRNATTGEVCEGILNLVDLAGSERLANSGAQGDRLKETQAINKSLSHLGNVIMALANKQQHIPYRDSKLTYLLQNSLGGNSKTLMFVNVSPREESLSESICSLRFATKVNACNIGTAQKRAK